MTQAKEITSDIVKAEEVIGVDVQNAKGEDLGTINTLVLDKRAGFVRYVVLSFGGFLGMGDKLFALPWEILSYNEARDCFVLDIPQEKLKNAPGFNKNQWPNMSDRKWGESIFNYYGSRPYWQK